MYFLLYVSCYMDLSKLQNGLVKVVTWICQNCNVDLSKMFYVFLALCQAKPTWSLTNILKLVEPSALNSTPWTATTTKVTSALKIPCTIVQSTIVLIKANHPQPTWHTRASAVWNRILWNRLRRNLKSLLQELCF